MFSLFRITFRFSMKRTISPWGPVMLNVLYLNPFFLYVSLIKYALTCRSGRLVPTSPVDGAHPQ